MAGATVSGAVDDGALELGALGLDRGAHLSIGRALAARPVGGRVVVRGDDPNLAAQLRGWCRAVGHGYEPGAGDRVAGVVVRGATEELRWAGAERAGAARGPDGVVEAPPARWGLAARGALIEAGDLGFDFALGRKSVVWADEAARLYAQAAAAQWDPATALPWDAAEALPAELEGAVVQVMTYLIENETAALIVPARVLSRLHPHFREVMQLLAIQTADEARHIEVFTRRALLRGDALGRSTQGGQASLKTLLDEPDFALGAFLLSVLGEGSFLDLLWFLHRHAPDGLTREVARLAAQDEARHVAFGLAHLARHAREEPALRARLAAAVERRHDQLRHVTGLNQEVHDALVVMAAGAWTPEAIAAGHDRVQAMVAAMDDGRRARLARLGFTTGEAEALSAMHTRNFM